MSASYDRAVAKAQTQTGYDPNWASATEHARDLWPAPNRRRKCYCGCKGRATHVGGANGIALTGGCELSMRRWVRDGFGGGSSSASLVLGALSATEETT